MATKKKGVKKVVAKKSVSKKATVTRPRAVSTAHVQEVFTTNPQQERTVEVPANSVALFVNGSNKGVVDTTGARLGTFAVAQAQRAGITSFSVYLDGIKADTGDKEKSLAGVSKIELVSKDARG